MLDEKDKLEKDVLNIQMARDTFSEVKKQLRDIYEELDSENADGCETKIKIVNLHEQFEVEIKRINNKIDNEERRLSEQLKAYDEENVENK